MRRESDVDSIFFEHISEVLRIPNLPSAKYRKRYSAVAELLAPSDINIKSMFPFATK